MKFTEKEHNYIESDEEREEGHEDTRYKNFECENRSRAAVFGRCPFLLELHLFNSRVYYSPV